jgi:hypothetical protein
MDSTRRISLWAGIWFLVTFVSIAALPFYDSILNDADYILGSGDDAKVRLGAFVEIITVVGNIGTAVVLFPLLRRVNETTALGYVAVRTVESTLIVIGLISLLSVVALRQDIGGDGATSPDSLEQVGRSLVALHDGTFLLGPAFCAGIGNGLLLGYMMYKSGLVPRGMAILGLVGGTLATITATLVLFGAYEQVSAWSFLLTLPEIAWELSLGIYMTFKGFRPAPVVAEYEADMQRRRAVRSAATA